MEPYFPKLTEPARRWVRLLVLVSALGLSCWIAYALRTVFTPLLIAAAIAYIFNPAVTWLERTRGVSRLTTVVAVTALLGALVVGGGFYAVHKTVVQVTQFQERIPRYVHTAGKWVEYARAHVPGSHPTTVPGHLPASAESAPTSAPATMPVEDWWQWASPLVREYGVQVARSTLEYIGSTAANVANLVSLLILIPVFTFYFLWRFNDFVTAARDHLPDMYRDGIVHVVGTIDAAIANFFRGRLIVCLAVGVLTGLGWSLVGVPYSLPLGVLTGLLNLVPFVSLLALPPALLFAFLGASEVGAPWLWPVVLTMGVYLGVQGLEAFVLSPAILGHTVGLHPLAIVVALLIGAEVAGLLGLLLAVPVASTLKTLAAEFLLPEVRRLAGWPVATGRTPGPLAGAPGDSGAEQSQG
jgi:predicted PurR-regulated permease PerM